MSDEKKNEEVGALDEDIEMENLTLVSEEKDKIVVKKSVAIMSELVKTMADTGFSFSPFPSPVFPSESQCLHPFFFVPHVF